MSWGTDVAQPIDLTRGVADLCGPPLFGPMKKVRPYQRKVIFSANDWSSRWLDKIDNDSVDPNATQGHPTNQNEWNTSLNDVYPKYSNEIACKASTWSEIDGDWTESFGILRHLCTGDTLVVRHFCMRQARHSISSVGGIYCHTIPSHAEMARDLMASMPLGY